MSKPLCPAPTAPGSRAEGIGPAAGQNRRARLKIKQTPPGKTARLFCPHHQEFNLESQDFDK